MAQVEASAPSRSPDPPAAPVDPAMLEEQLQLLQLCFGEYDFGVEIDDAAVEGVDVGGDARGGLPSMAFEFHPAHFVNDKVRHGISLEVLVHDLATYTRVLESQIAHHVHHDVQTAFFDVSGYLVGMQEDLQYLPRPLEATLKKAEASSQRVGELVEAVEAKVRQAAEAELERAFDATLLQGILLYDALVDEMEELTALADAELATTSTNAEWSAAHTATSSTGPPAPALSNTTLQQLESAALGVGRLAAIADLLPLSTTRHEPRMEFIGYVEAARSGLRGLLRRVLRSISMTCASSSSSCVIDSLQRFISIYELLGEQEECRQALRQELLRPMFEAVVSWKAATHARQQVHEAVKLLEQLEETIRCRVVPLLPTLQRAFDGRLMPAALILWPSLGEVLVKKLVALFEVGMASAFQQRYVAAYRLLALTERCCAHVEELRVLRQLPDIALWNHKWNIDVYVALRAAEMEKVIAAASDSSAHAADEGAAANNSSSSSSSPSPAAMPSSSSTTNTGFDSPIIATLAEQLLRLTSPDVFIYACTPAFLRLAANTCQHTLRGIFSELSGEGTSPSVATAASASAASSPNTQNPHSPTPSSLSGAALLTAQVKYVADIKRLGTFVVEVLQPRFDAAISASSSSSSDVEVANVVDGEALHRIFTWINATLCASWAAQMEESMCQRVIDESGSALQHIKTVRSAYLRTKKAFPTEVSWFVATITAPILTFVAQAQSCGLPVEMRQRLTHRAVRCTSTAYAKLVHEVLLSAKRTVESWEKLRRLKEASAAGGGAGAGAEESSTTSGRVNAETATDRDRIMMQLYLDVKSYTAALAPTLPPAELQPLLAELHALVQRGAWMEGADIPEPPDIDDLPEPS